MTATKKHAPRNCGQATRLIEAATTLRARDDLGPADVRQAVAGWLEHCANATQHMLDLSAGLPTLPCVEAVLDAIEAAQEGQA